MFHPKADKKEEGESGYKTKDGINRVKNGMKNEVSKWVLCFTSCLNSLTSMHMVLCCIQYDKWEELKPPIMQCGSTSSL